MAKLPLWQVSYHFEVNGRITAHNPQTALVANNGETVTWQDSHTEQHGDTAAGIAAITTTLTNNGVVIPPGGKIVFDRIAQQGVVLT